MPTTCTPQSLYGPYYQTRFCGASIMNFSVSAGWNEQTSELTVDLVEDCSTTNKRIEYGTDLEATIVTDADEFSEPHVGSAVYFRIGDEIDESGGYSRNSEGGFEFTGLIQSWNRKNDTSGNPTYSVKLTDPRVILDQSHVIVSDLGEDVFVAPADSNRGLLAVPNVINAYGWLEALDADCRNAFDITGTSYPTYINGVAVGSLTGGFGGADVNNRGMRWNLLKKALGILLSSDQIPYVVSRAPFNREVSTDGYSPYGRLMYRGGGNKQSTKTPGKTLLPGSGVLGPTPEDATGRRTRYMVDLTEIPFSPDHYRITGPTLTFTELITQVCEAAGCDYYIELLPVKGLGGINLVIKVRVVQRREQPKLGEIQDYVDEQDFVVSKTFGQELANQPNSIFIFGAKRQDYVQQDGYPYIVPSGGLDTDGIPIRVFFGNLGAAGSANQWWYLLDFRQVESTLNNSFTTNYSTNGFAWVSESEIRCAAVDREIWREFVVSRLGDSRSPCTRWMLNWETLTGREFTPLMGPGVLPAVNRSPDVDGVYRADMERMHQFIQTFATTFYGRRWFINIPGVCRDYNFEAVDASGFRPAPYYSDDPSTDGAWPTIGNVLGLTMPSAALDFFALDETGKIGPILRFSGGVTTRLDTGTFLSANTDNYVKARMEPRWAFGTPDFSNNTPSAWVEVEMSGPITDVPSGPIEGQRRAAIVLGWFGHRFQANVDGPINEVAAAAWAGTLDTRLERSIFTGFVIDAMHVPLQAGIPLVSRSRCYGPWGNLARGTINNDLYNVDELISGKLNVVHDEGFAPWEYGSFTLMNEAAESAVELSITEMQVAERGQVSVPGYPNKRIGSALNTTDTSAYDMTLSPDNYGDFVFFKVDLLPPEGIKNTSASISNVNVNISPQGVQTEYTLSTFTPVFGRFAKSNADSLKRLGQLRLRFQRGMRAAVNRAGGQQVGGGAVLFNLARRQFGPWTPHSASPWIAGQLKRPGRGKLSDGPRKEVVIQQSSDQVFFNEYDTAAIMSLDGLLRPVSKYGDGDLPHYQSNPGVCNKSHSPAPPPPLNGYEPLTVVTKQLDPLANPKTVDPDGVTNRDGNGTYGHDFEDVARSTTNTMADVDSVSGFINVQDAAYHGLSPGYTQDYRFMALRGPLVIQGWGYDIHGHPVPNEVDEFDAAGNIDLQTKHNDLTNQFKEGWLNDSQSWPVGPVDLRFDRQRGVWTAPPGYRVYKVRANEPISPNAKKPVTVIDDVIEDVANIAKETKQITITNITCTTIPEDCEFLAYYDTVNCEYWPIFPGSNLGVSCTDEEVPSCQIGSDPEYKYEFIEFGKNLNVKEKLDFRDGRVGAVVSAPDSTSDIGIACSDLTTTSCDPAETPVYDYKFIEFGKNLKVQNKSYDGKDGVLVSAAGLGLSVKDTPYCGKDANAALKSECTATDCLVFGWGIEVEEVKADEVKIMAPMWIYTEGKEPLAADLANNLAIGRGLCVSDGGEKCEKIVRADIGIYNTSKCASLPFEGENCEKNEDATNGVVGIIAGPGIAALVGDNAPLDDDAEDEEKQWVQFQSELKITDCDNETIADPLLEIQLGCGLKGVGWVPCTDDEGRVGDSTKVQIELDPMSDTSCTGDDVEVTVVCGISCSAEGIETLSKQLVFNSCGLFKGTKYLNGTLNNAKEGEESNSTPTDVGCKKSSDSTGSEYKSAPLGSP